MDYPIVVDNAHLVFCIQATSNSTMVSLDDSGRQVETICDGCNQCDQIEQRRDAMDLAKLLVQGLHLLRVWRGIPTLLAIFLLCYQAGSVCILS